MKRTLDQNFPLATAHASIPSHVVYRAFAAETVILNLETGKYHGVNATGGRMLECLDRYDRVSEALTALASGYGKKPAEVEDHLRVFCVRLHERGLIDVTHDGSS